MDSISIQQAIRYQTTNYPLSTLKDLYKSFFQDAFGPGHLGTLTDEGKQQMLASLKRELIESAQEKSALPYFEKTGATGNFYRVSLSVINDKLISLDVFFAAFIKSAETFTVPSLDVWRNDWTSILKELEKTPLTLPGMKKDREEIEHLLEKGQYALSHSEIFRNAYHPHYRLIEKSVFDNQLLQLLHVNSDSCLP